MKIRLTEDIDRGWNDLMTGREFHVWEVLGKKPDGTHVLVQARTGSFAHIFPDQYEVLDEPED